MTTTRLLLDTHTLIWWSASPTRLSATVRRLLEDEDTEVGVSWASAWEIATKVRLGKLTWTSRTSVESYCITQRLSLLPMLVAHAERGGSWPHAHGDLSSTSAISASFHRLLIHRVCYHPARTDSALTTSWLSWARGAFPETFASGRDRRASSARRGRSSR